MLRVNRILYLSAVGQHWINRTSHGWRHCPSLGGFFDTDGNVRLAYGKALLYLASGDEQREWVLDYASEVLGCDHPATTAMVQHCPTPEDVEVFAKVLELCPAPQRGQAANCLLYDAIRMMTMDYNYDRVEKIAIRKVAQRLLVPQSLIQEIERLAEEERCLDRMKESLWVC